MIRPLLLLAAAALLAPAAALAQGAPLPPASTAPAAATPPAVGGEGGGMGRYGGGANASPEMRQARQAMMQACSADFAKFCADAQAGGGGRMQCIRAHASELSDGCRGSMQAMRAARGGGGGAAPQGATPQPAGSSPG